MKNLYTFIVASLLGMSTFAQSPEMMSYQAVVRDVADNLVASSPVGVQISILQGSSSGTASYVETHTPTSNQNGLVSIEIGNGTLVSGDFDTIDWASGPYFIKTETDPTGGTSYTISGISQLLSVPYALYAKNTAAWQTNNDTTYTLNTVGVGVNSPVANFHLQNGGFSDLLIESTGSVEDASIWLKNPSKSWRIHGDQNDSDKLKIGLWTDYSEIGGSIIFQSSVTIDTLGNVGIGAPNPQRTLHVDDVMRLEPRAIAPTSPSKGDMYMDDITNKLMVYDGTTWQACW
jgi:hypothetical protein